MHRHGVLITALLYGSVAQAQGPRRPAGRPAEAGLVLDGVTVVDVEQGRLVPNQRVVILGNRIQAMGAMNAIALPKGARVVDAHSKYLIPGLWDMHTHAVAPRGPGDAGHREVYPQLVAYGITGIREMASSWPAGFDSIRQQRREIAAGTLIGPRVVATSYDFYSPVCSPEARQRYMDVMMNALGGLVPIQMIVPDTGCIIPNPQTVRTPAEVRRLVDTLAAGGVDFVKAHMVSDRQVYFAFLAEARRVGLPAVGHLGGADGRAVTELEASDSGLRSVEHINEVGCWQDERHRPSRWAVVPLPDAVAARQCALVAEHFKRNGTWLVPTLYNLVTRPEAKPYHEAYTHAVGLLHRLGVPLLAGSDADADQPVASALHEELALLVGAGLTPHEALEAATSEPAKFFRATDSLGTVAPGQLADLVLLDADPLADIANTTRIRAVVANGRYYDRAALDRLLAEVQRTAERPPAPATGP